MNKNNLIRFAQSLVFLPLVAGTMSLGSVTKTSILETSRTVFIEKENNLKANGALAFNQVVDAKAKTLKAQAEAIDAYFKSHNMPLVGYGAKMAEESEKNDLDWRLLPAISARESTGGRNDCIKVENNPFGWGSCKIGFKSVNEAIETVAKNLGGNNPSTVRHYADKTIKQILRAYNPPSIVPHYAEQVIKIMNDIGPEDLMEKVVT